MHYDLRRAYPARSCHLVGPVTTRRQNVALLLRGVVLRGVVANPAQAKDHIVVLRRLSSRHCSWSRCAFQVAPRLVAMFKPAVMPYKLAVPTMRSVPGSGSGGRSQLQDPLSGPNRCLVYLGRAYLETGNNAEARRTLEKAVQLDNDDPLAHLYLGIALLKPVNASEVGKKPKQALDRSMTRLITSKRISSPGFVGMSTCRFAMTFE